MSIIPSEQQIKKFVSYYDIWPRKNYLLVNKRSSALLESLAYLGGESTLYKTMVEKPYVMIFTEKNLILKELVGFEELIPENYETHLQILPLNEVAQFKTNKEVSPHYISFIHQDKKNEFYIESILLFKNTFSLVNYQHLTTNGFFGLLNQSASSPAELLSESTHSINPLTSFLSKLKIIAIIYFVSIVIISQFFAKTDLMYVSLISAFLAPLLAIAIDADPKNWTTKDYLFQIACCLLLLLSFFSFAISLLNKFQLF